MSSNMLISIIIPCFNCEQTIRRTVNSLLQQNYDNVEIILVDDGSEDNTASIIDDIGLEDTRIIVKHTSNQGVSHARNIGIDLARGSFITFVDSDDELEPNILLRAATVQKNSDADMVIFGHADIAAGKQSSDRHDYSIVNPIDLMFTQHDETFFQVMFELERSRYLFSCWGKLIRKSWIGDTRFDSDIIYGEDTTWILTLLRRAGRVVAMPDVGYLYHQSSQGLLNSFSVKKAASIVKAHQQQARFYSWSQMSDEYQRFAQLRLTNDVVWALQTAKTAPSSVSLQERMEFTRTLTRSPLRPIYMRNIKSAATSKLLKILFILDNSPLWSWYLR